MTRRTFPAFCCLAAIALSATCIEASVVIIDDFDDGAVALVANSGAPTAFSSQATTSAIGGFRDTTVMYASGLDSVRAKSFPVPGVMSFSTDSLTTGVFDLAYDGAGAGLGGTDITDSGMNTFLFVDFISADMGAELTITLNDSTATAMLSESLAGGPGRVAFKLSDFVGVDLTSLESILVNIEGEQDGDYTIDNIYAGVPEPSTIAIWSLFGVGMAVYVRRQRKC